MPTGDLEHQDDGSALASRLMQAILTTKGDVQAAVGQVFAWTSHLSPHERDQLTRDVTDHLRSATELGDYDSLLGVIRSWEGTAEAYAAGYTRASTDELTWLDDEPTPDGRV